MDGVFGRDREDVQAGAGCHNRLAVMAGSMIMYSNLNKVECEPTIGAMLNASSRYSSNTRF